MDDEYESQSEHSESSSSEDETSSSEEDEECSEDDNEWSPSINVYELKKRGCLTDIDTDDELEDSEGENGEDKDGEDKDGEDKDGEDEDGDTFTSPLQFDPVRTINTHRPSSSAPQTPKAAQFAKTGALGKRKLFQDRPSSSIDSIDSEALLQAGPLVPLIIEVTFKELREVRGTIGNTKSGRQVLEELQKRYDFEVTTKLLSQVSKIICQIKQWNRDKKGKPFVDDCVALKLNVPETNAPAEPPSKRKPPTPKKLPLDDLKPRSLEKRTNEYADQMIEFMVQKARQDGVDVYAPDSKIQFEDIIARTIRKTCPEYKDHARDISKRTKPKPRKIPPLPSLGNKVETRSTTRVIDKWRKFIRDQTGFELPSQPVLRALAKERTSELRYDPAVPINQKERPPPKKGEKKKKRREPITTAPGVLVISYQDALKKSIQQLIQLGKIPRGVKSIKVNLKDGMDGAGNQIEIKARLSSMITMGFVILDVWDTSDPDPANHKKIWENPYPNSNFSFKPLAMVLGAETEDLFTYLCEKFKETQANTMIDYDGMQLGATWKIQRTMIDGKIRNIVSGRKGAHCMNCHWLLEDYYKKENGPKVMETHYLLYKREEAHQNLIKLFNKYGHGRLYKSAKARKNFTHRPITPADSMTVLHSWINCTNVIVENMAKVACMSKEQIAAYKPWKNLWKKSREKVELKKKEIVKKVKEVHDVILKNVGHGNTGGGLVGNHAKRFFELWEEIPALVLKDEAQIKAFQTLMKKLSMILRVINSNLPIYVNKYNILCKEAVALIRRDMPYFRYTPQLHTVLFHSWEHMARHADFLGEGSEDNKMGRGLKKLAEDAAEMAMGRARNARKFQAFRGSVRRNIEDAMKVLMLESDITINDKFKKTKRSQEKYHKISLLDERVREFIDVLRLSPEDREKYDAGLAVSEE